MNLAASSRAETPARLLPESLRSPSLASTRLPSSEPSDSGSGLASYRLLRIGHFKTGPHIFRGLFFTDDSRHSSGKQLTSNALEIRSVSSNFIFSASAVDSSTVSTSATPLASIKRRTYAVTEILKNLLCFLAATRCRETSPTIAGFD